VLPDLIVMMDTGLVALADADKGGDIAAAQHLIQDFGPKGQLFTLDALQ
jgi:hypothetical protein